MTRLPLENVRVIDLGMFWAGPCAASILADMGAEVIKIEACSRPEPDRFLIPATVVVDSKRGDVKGPNAPWNRNLLIHRRHRNKLGITLDLKAGEAARKLFLTLVALSDVLIENFRGDVMSRLGFDYATLRRRNPTLIMASLSGHGADGPEFWYGGNAILAETSGGLRSITGYPGMTPDRSGPGTSLPDVAAGVLGAGLIAAGLTQRRCTGRGTYIDVSQRETVTSMVGESVLGYLMTGRLAEPLGNRHPVFAPQGCYRCKGGDQWVTLTVENDEQWERLCQAMGCPELVLDARFQTVTGRRLYHNEIDELITGWTMIQEKWEVTAKLQEQEIPSGPVLSAADLLEDAHLRHRNFLRPYGHAPFEGYITKAPGFQIKGLPFSVRKKAPDLGGDNDTVYGELMGLSADNLERLEREGVVGSEPTADVLQGALGRELGLGGLNCGTKDRD